MRLFKRDHNFSSEDEIHQRTLHKNLNFTALEQYKLLRANLDFTVPEGTKCPVIGVTSSIRSEGKSTTSVNLSFVHNYYVHSFYPKSDYKKYVMIVSADYATDIDKILSASSLPSHLKDAEFNREKILPLLKKLSLEDNMPQLVKKGYLNVVMGLLFDYYPTVPIKTSSNIESIVAVLEYIDTHFAKALSLESIAAEFGYNKYYFSRFFNRYIGENLTNYINIVRINNFMNLSKKYKSPQISKLAAECGFESMPTFYRSFKKLYGETPKSYFSKM